MRIEDYALVGDWQIAPANGAIATSRRYRPGTLVLVLVTDGSALS
jgi:hypothetical protein